MKVWQSSANKHDSVANSANIHFHNFTESANFSHLFFSGHSVLKSVTFELFDREVGLLATVDTAARGGGSSLIQGLGGR